MLEPGIHRRAPGAVVISLALVAVIALGAVALAADGKAQGTQDRGVLMIEYKVQKGDTLSGIAKKFDVSVDTILRSNRITNPNKISAGQVLRFPSLDGVFYEVKPGDSLWEIAKRYKVTVSAIVDANDLADPGKIKPKDVIFLPGAESPSNSRQALASRSATGRTSAAGIQLAWPVNGRITSDYGERWGRMHNGLDIAAPTGTSIRAAASGTVVSAGWAGTYGKLVIIDHGNGLRTYYGHCSSILVSEGERVKAGQVIAKVGSTGRSTGPHLHLEVRINGRPADPEKYL